MGLRRHHQSAPEGESGRGLRNDIEAFYEADERRRASAEIELGQEWHDSHGNRYELSWIEDTGELYVMTEPRASIGTVPQFDFWEASSLPVSSLTVVLLGQIGAREDVERILAGWEEAMGQPDSLTWIVDRLRAAGVGPAAGS